MAISVAVPKNLSGIKTKVAFNLTKRQLMQRWVNNKRLFYSVKDFKDYDPSGSRGTVSV